MAKKRNISGKSIIVLFFLIGLILFGGYFMLTGNDPIGLFSEIVPATETAESSASLLPTLPATETAELPTSLPPTLPATEMAESPASLPPTLPVPAVESATHSDWWEVYFVNHSGAYSAKNYAGSIEDELIKKIDGAMDSIHIASFEFNLTPVADALIRAQERGVDVRWVTDDEHGLEADEDPGRGQFEMLEDAGIEIRDDARGALMHNKFWIFDKKILWTGSTNITESGVFEQDNNTIVIHSPALAEIYEREFEEMWNGEFGPRSPSTVENQQVNINGTPIQILFAAEDDVAAHLLRYLDNAQSSIRFLAFSFTHDAMGESIRNRYIAGVDVMGVFEKTGSSTEYSELGKMYCAGMAVRRDENRSFLHDKVIIIDDRIVITGSFNFSDNADESNDENVLIIDNPEIAALYLQEFNRIWAMSSDPAPDKFSCE